MLHDFDKYASHQFHRMHVSIPNDTCAVVLCFIMTIDSCNLQLLAALLIREKIYDDAGDLFWHGEEKY